MKKKKGYSRKKLILGVCDSIGSFLISLLSTFLAFLILYYAVGPSKISDFEGDNATIFFFVLLSSLTVAKLLLEALFKNSPLYKNLVSSFGGSFILSFAVDAIAWLIIYLCHQWSNLWIYFIDSCFYIVLVLLYRGILIKINSKKGRDIVIVSEKDEALLLASKMIKWGRHNDTMHVYFANQYEIDDVNLKKAIDGCDALYVGKTLRSHLKNEYMSYATMDQYKAAYIVPNTYEITLMKPDIGQADDTLMFEAQPIGLTLTQRFIKRFFDIFCSCLALLVLWPLMGIIALILHLQDGGPAIYKQERVTKGGRVFILYKFRSMVVNAEKQTGAVLMTSEDDRLTKVGRFIRKTRIDELPQLWNILKGDMSIVGPRPERPVFVEQFLKETPGYRYRFNVRAGLTGYAQVRGNYHTVYTDKLGWDLMYIRKYSFLNDLWLILLTALAVFDKRSASGTEQKEDPQKYLNECGHKIIKQESHWDIEKK